MNTNRWIGIGAGTVGVLLALALWLRRDRVRVRISSAADSARGMARSTWGRMSDAADRLTHTERPPQSSI